MKKLVLLAILLSGLGYAQNEVSRSVETVAREWGETTDCEDWERTGEVTELYKNLLSKKQLGIRCYIIYLDVKSFQPYVNESLTTSLTWDLVDKISWAKDGSQLYALSLKNNKVTNAFHFYTSDDDSNSFITIYTWN